MPTATCTPAQHGHARGCPTSIRIRLYGPMASISCRDRQSPDQPYLAGWPRTAARRARRLSRLDPDDECGLEPAVEKFTRLWRSTRPGRLSGRAFADAGGGLACRERQAARRAFPGERRLCSGEDDPPGPGWPTTRPRMDQRPPAGGLRNPRAAPGADMLVNGTAYPRSNNTAVAQAFHKCLRAIAGELQGLPVRSCNAVSKSGLEVRAPKTSGAARRRSAPGRWPG